MSDTLVRLRPELTFSPARNHQKVSYVVEDHVQKKYWKIGELEYEICTVVDGSRPAMDYLRQLLLTSPLAKAAGPEKVHKILAWMMHAGLLEACPNSPKSLSQPNEPPTDSKKPTKLFDPSFFRIPLLSSEVIERYSRNLGWLLSIPCLCIAMVAWCIAIGMSIQNYHELADLGQKLFVPGSQWWWLFAWFILKAVHESGHAIACTRVGAKTNGAGIGFMFFAPSPYVDVSNLWSVENKWSRILVSASGMLFELTLSAVAIIGACTVENPSLRYLCFSIATLGTFATVAFNGNPLMRYDGYYMAIDLFDRPNLWQDASQLMKNFFATWIFKNRSLHSLSLPLLAYGTASWLSRMLLLITMGWGVWKTWDGIGLVIVIFFACLWFILPPIMRIANATTNQKNGPPHHAFSQVCPWKTLRCVGLAIAVGFCSLLPSPLQVYWPAIVDYVDPSDVRSIAPGFVQEVFVHDGQGVQAGDEILRLSNPALELEYQAALSAQKSSEEKCAALRAQRKHSELGAEEAILESLVVKSNSLQSKVESLRLKAPRDGVLIARASQNLVGSYIAEGHSIGMVANPSQIEVRASVPQDAWETISHNVNAPVSIYMESGDHWNGKVIKTLPHTSDTLDSPSLGGLYGGPITVVMHKTPDGEERLTTNAPRLQTRIELDHSRSGGHRAPPPGLYCSVHLNSQREAIWQTAFRWIHAAAKSRFQETVD